MRRRTAHFAHALLVLAATVLLPSAAQARTAKMARVSASQSATANSPVPAAQPAAAAPDHMPQLMAEAKSRVLCERAPDRIFVEHDLGTECIFFYATPGTPQHQATVLYFEGDVPAADVARPEYTRSYLADMRTVFQRLAAQSGVRIVFVARPGVFGSSGNHANRRSVAEMLAMNAAVDALKVRLALTDIVLAGQSGGSTIAAAMLTLGRRDVTCAVLGSGLLSVVEIEHAHRVKAGLPTVRPALLHVYLFDPTDRLEWIPAEKQRRVFVLGDPADGRTPFSQQKRFAESLRALDHHAIELEVQGQGDFSHSVAHLTLPAAAQCARGASDVAIQQQVAAARGSGKPSTQTSQLQRR